MNKEIKKNRARADAETERFFFSIRNQHDYDE